MSPRHQIASRRAGPHVGEHRLEGVAVAVDVGDDGDLHGSSRPAWAVGHSLRTWNAPAGLPWPWLLPSSSRRRRSCCCGHVTASSRPCRSTPDRTSRPPSWSARATTATASSCSSPPARRSRRRCSCGSCAARPRGCAGPFRRPVLVAAGAGAALSVGFAAARLPVGAISHHRSVDVGLSTQDWGPWLGDVAKSTAIGAVFAGAGAGGRAGAHAPLPARLVGRPAASLAVGFATASIYLGPVVLDPIFNRFTAAARGAHARRRAGARARGGGRRRPGLRGRRQPAHDGLQRLRHRAGARPSASSSTTTC